MANLFDADNAPTTEPKEFAQGERVQWKRTDLSDDYDPASYSLIYTARKQGTGDTFTFTATEVSSEYLIVLSSSTTDTYAPGEYIWQAEIERTSDSERIKVDEGTFEVVQDLADNLADTRSHAAIMLSKIESLLENRADKDVANYSIAGRSITKLSPAELLEWRDVYRTEVANEKRAADLKAGRAVGTTIKVRFP